MPAILLTGVYYFAGAIAVNKKYLTPEAWAKLHGSTRQRAHVFLSAGRVRGAIQAGKSWAIPADAEWPAKNKSGGRPKKPAKKAAKKVAKKKR